MNLLEYDYGTYFELYRSMVYDLLNDMYQICVGIKMPSAQNDIKTNSHFTFIKHNIYLNLTNGEPKC